MVELSKLVFDMKLTNGGEKSLMKRKLILMALITALALIMVVPASAATTYTYGKVAASNGVVLHYMKGSPNDITLRKISSNLKGQSNYGINGGFFNFSDGGLLSIAVNNDVPVGGGSLTDNYKGAHNTKYDRGTLVWDKSAKKYSVQVVRWASNLAVTDRKNYWAQGGVSMGLNDEANWKTQASNEGIPGGISGSSSGRAGVVYNSGGNIWLVVTNSTCTPEQFRTAIKEKIGSNTLVNGIFLDGSGSSQMRALDSSGTLVNVTGDSRTVYQMISF